MTSRTLEIVEHETAGVNIVGGDHITNKVHDQKKSSLCWAHAQISALRTAVIKCVKENNGQPNQKMIDDNIRSVKKLLDDGGDYQRWSHRRMLGNYLFNVFPRSFEGIGYDRYGNDLESMKDQTAEVERGMKRLCYPTVMHKEGWKYITNYKDWSADEYIFSEFGLAVSDFKLVYEEVYHPSTQNQLNQQLNSTNRNFDDILAEDNVIVTSALNDYKYDAASGKYKSTNGHAMVLIGKEIGKIINGQWTPDPTGTDHYLFKNSYSAQSIVPIPKDRPSYYGLLHHPTANNQPAAVGCNDQSDFFIFDAAYVL